MSDAAVFPYHWGTAPIMWVFFALALIELFAVHLLVATRWPAVGWPLSIISVIGVLWIFLLIRSFPRYPHRIEGDKLVLHFGKLRRLTLDLVDIAGVEATWEAGGDKAADAIRLSGIAYPNRCLILAKPTARGKRRVFIRLDDPEAFNNALIARGAPLNAPHR